MYRTALVAIVLLAFLTCQSDTKSFAEKKKVNNLLGKLNGVYGFVSESTVLIKPRKEILRRSEPEWSGVWHFQNSHYSRILMKRKRDRFYNSTKLEDLGFEGFSGTYKAEGQGILLPTRI